MTFYLVRHGETDWNKEHRLQGQTNIPMNENGIRQMKDLAEKMAHQGLKVDKIISSPLDRAMDSAAIIAEAIDYSDEVLVDEDFIERSFGLLEGKVWDYSMNFDDPKYQTETLDILCDRAKAALDKYGFSGDDKVLILSHGAFLTALRIVLSDYRFGYLDGNYPIIQGNVLCCELSPEKDPHFYNLF